MNIRAVTETVTHLDTYRTTESKENIAPKIYINKNLNKCGFEK